MNCWKTRPCLAKIQIQLTVRIRPLTTTSTLTATKGLKILMSWSKTWNYYRPSWSRKKKKWPERKFWLLSCTSSDTSANFICSCVRSKASSASIETRWYTDRNQRSSAANWSRTPSCCARGLWHSCSVKAKKTSKMSRNYSRSPQRREGNSTGEICIGRRKDWRRSMKIVI